MKKIVFLVVVFGLFLVACATTSQFTPLPWGVKVISPSPDLPKNITGFSGTWYGVWDNGRPTTLVVQKIKPPKADVIYSWGPMGKEREGGFTQDVGEIKPGKLTVVNPERGITITYLLSDDGEKLKGEFRLFRGVNYTTMKRQPYTLFPAASQFTPLPLMTKIIPPSLGLPKNITCFSGIWYGTWDNGHSTTLVIEKIDLQEVIAVYSWGKFRDVEGGWTRNIGRIEPDKRKVTIVSEQDLSITYTLSGDGEKLEGQYKRPSKSQISYVTMQRQPPISSIALSTKDTPTPLPVNIKIIPPTSNISSSLAAFSGIWQGIWENGRVTTLVVEKIESPEAIAIYSWGPWKKEGGGWRRHIGMIDPGRLILSNPETELIITFLLSKDGQTLDGTWQKGGGKKLKATMRRQ